MKVIYMECTLALIAGINPSLIEQLSNIGELKQTENHKIFSNSGNEWRKRV
jgi:hypothetical protein